MPRWAPCAAGSGAGFVLRAPVAGRVLKLHQTSEATVALGTPLLELGDTAQLEIVAELLTSDALAAAPRQRRAHRALGRAERRCRGACAASSRRPSPRSRRWASKSSA